MPSGSTITLFTPSFADANDTNAQNLAVKEIVSRLPEDRFRVVMTFAEDPDPRIAARKNTVLIPYRKHGNAARLLIECLSRRVDIYFYPRVGPLDRAFFAIRRRLSLKTRLVTHVLMVMNEKTASPAMARSIREADAVLGNSVYVAETIRRHFGIHAEVIYDGIDRRFYFPSNETERTPEYPLTVLYAGSFQQRKRVGLVIRQASRLPNVNFRLAGMGPTLAPCRALAAQLGCRNVTFLGHLPSGLLGEEMRRADVFLFPSILEGHPQVLGQAMACGLPAIAMNLYRPDYVVHGKTGFLVESDEEITPVLDLLLNNRGLRQQFVIAAAKHATKFDWDVITRKWQRVLESLVRGDGSRLSAYAAD